MAISYHIEQRDASTISKDTPARITIAGGVVTVTASSQGGRAPATVRIAGGQYARRDTGEIICPDACLDGGEDTPHVRDLRASMAVLRDIIRAGVKPGSVWTTHTYRALVRDPAAVYADWKAYIRWVREVYLHRQVEYITAIEPQARGSWHIHGILIPPSSDPEPLYIPQAEALAAWRRIAARRMPEGDARTSGGVHLHRIEDGGDDLGAYLSAYLGDVGGKKGGRWAFYPPHMRFWRCSRGVERPRIIEGLTLEEARKLAAEHTGQAAPGYARGYDVHDCLGRWVSCGCREQYKRPSGAPSAEGDER